MTSETTVPPRIEEAILIIQDVSFWDKFLPTVLQRAWWWFLCEVMQEFFFQDMKWQMDQMGNKIKFYPKWILKSRRVTVTWVQFHIQLCSIINCLWLVISYLSIPDDNIDGTLGISCTGTRTLVNRLPPAKLLEPIQVSTQVIFSCDPTVRPVFFFCATTQSVTIK